MLSLVAVAAHVGGLREFNGALVAQTLSAKQLEFWEKMAAEEGGLPIMKVLELASEEGAT